MPNNNDTTPDILLHTKNLINHIQNIELIPDLGSDHFGITFELICNIEIKEEPFLKYNLNSCNMQHLNGRMLSFVSENNIIN